MQNGSYSLPAFLKSHFRPVACVQPDREMICAVSLYSDGFSQAQVSYQQLGKIKCFINIIYCWPFVDVLAMYVQHI